VRRKQGRNAPRFQQAQRDPRSPWRDWFVFDPRIPGGARTWKGVHNLPELNLEHAPVREHLWAAPDSVVRSYLRDGADGWRLDTAYELGHEFLAQLTAAAHAEKPASLVVGEIVNYPAGWMPAMDGVMNFHLRTLESLSHGTKSRRAPPRSATFAGQRSAAHALRRGLS
jgi:glycosidase